MLASLTWTLNMRFHDLGYQESFPVSELSLDSLREDSILLSISQNTLHKEIYSKARGDKSYLPSEIRSEMPLTLFCLSNIQNKKKYYFTDTNFKLNNVRFPTASIHKSEFICLDISIQFNQL